MDFGDLNVSCRRSRIQMLRVPISLTQSLANVRSQVRWTAGPLALRQTEQGVRLNNCRFFSLCIGRHPQNPHPKVSASPSSNSLTRCPLPRFPPVAHNRDRKLDWRPHTFSIRSSANDWRSVGCHRNNTTPTLRSIPQPREADTNRYSMD